MPKKKTQLCLNKYLIMKTKIANHDARKNDNDEKLSLRQWKKKTVSKYINIRNIERKTISVCFVESWVGLTFFFYPFQI